MLLLLDLISPAVFSKLAVSAFLAILFLQSGFDKVFNWQGNLDWLKGHFAKTFLKDSVPYMLGVVTFLEVVSGIFCGVGSLEILFWGSTKFSLLGAELSALVLVMLFFGQRIAQDYAGAAGLVPYFLVSLVSIFLLS